MRANRTRTVITAIAVAILVVLMAVVAIVASTPAAKFDGISVATDGNINLRFYYTISDDSITQAEVEISDAGLDPVTVKVPIRTRQDGKKYFNVELAAAQMGCDVTVTPLMGDGAPACESKTFSVRDYAELVLENGDHSAYYSAVKSIVNYGAYAHKYFEASINNNVVENDGIYSRLTNPVINMGYELGTASAKTVTVSAEGISDAYYVLVLDSYIQIRLYYTYTGEGATNGWHIPDTDRYYVDVANISTADYATQYELAATVDGEVAASVEVSVLDCLKTLAADPKTADIAHAMYYYYLNTAGAENVPARTDCTHPRMHYEATALGANTSKAVCSYCGKIMSGPVSDDVNYYSAPGQQFNVANTNGLGTTGAQTGTLMTDAAGFVYNHIDLQGNSFVEFFNGTMEPIRGLGVNGTYQGGPLDSGDKIMGGSGKYIVFKAKWNSGSFRLETNASDDKGGAASYANQNRGANTSWGVYVVDIAKLGNNSSYSAGADVSNVAVGVSTGGSGTYMDIAYFAICDTWEEVASVVGTENVRYVTAYANPSADVSRNSLGRCIGGCTASVISSNNGLYEYGCAGCNNNPELVGTVKVDLTDVNFFTLPGQIRNISSAGGKQIYDARVAGTVKIDDDGTVYQSIPMYHEGYFEFTNDTTDPIRGHGINGTHNGSGSADKGNLIEGGLGKYFVVKIRVDGITQLRWDGNATNDNGGKATFSKTQYRNVGNELADGWVTYVVEIDKLDNFTEYTNGVGSDRVSVGMGISQRDETNWSQLGTIDIAYFAICDDWTEVARVAGKDKVKLIETWEGSAAGKDLNSDGSCIGDCNIVATQSGNKYTYNCEKCGKTYDEFTMSSDINYYSAPGQIYNNWNAGAASNGTCKSVGTIKQDPKGFLYTSIKMYMGGSFEFTNGSITPLRGYGVNGKRSSDKDPIDPGDTINGGTGKYFVLKMRATDIQKVLFIANGDDDNGGIATRTDSQSRKTLDITAGEWVVYVIDIEKFGLAHYKANQTDVTNICVGMQTDTDGYNATTGEGWSGNEVLDIAYFAICDDWKEVSEVVGDETVLYTDWKSTANDVYLNSDGTPIVELDDVMYEKTGENMYIYIRSNVEGVDKYTRYEFKRVVNEATKFDSWKISNIDICDSNLTFLYTTVVGACELEAAIEEKGAADFVGGYHGDEYMTGIKILIDGVELDMSKDYELSGCDSVQAVVESYLNRCDTTQKLFERVKIDTWTKDGLVIYNKFDVLEDVFVHRAATSMLAIAYRDGIITEHRNTNLDWTAIPDYQVQNATDVTLGFTYNSAGVTWAELRGKINVRVEMTGNTINGVLTEARGSFNYDHFGGTERRVKIYIEPKYDFQLYAGDVYECTSTQSIFAAE